MAARSSSRVSEPTPSHMISLSSLRSWRSLVRSWKRRTGSGPKEGMPRKLQSRVSCCLLSASGESTCLKCDMTCSVSSRDRRSPSLIRRMNLLNRSRGYGSSASPPPASAFALVALFSSFARSSRVCSSTLATSRRTLRSLIRFSSIWCFSSNVDGSRFGKSRIANGSANSIIGTRRKKASGMTRSRSPSTRTSRLCSRRERTRPRIIFTSSCEAIRVSAASSLLPCQ
mmetsp:Transcript_466/g.1323  ORF Transcript_466/g.1323 Transcript_466/m.1323 type:complete len:228 (+) Transcript_466:1222-1905(+)